MIELLPCPFCGGCAHVRRIGNEHTKKRAIMVRCPACRIERTDACLHYGFDWLEDVAARHWNQRFHAQPKTMRRMTRAEAEAMNRAFWLSVEIIDDIDDREEIAPGDARYYGAPETQGTEHD